VLFAICDQLSAVCCVMSAYCVLSDVCYLLSAICYLRPAVCCLLSAVSLLVLIYITRNWLSTAPPSENPIMQFHFSVPVVPHFSMLSHSLIISLTHSLTRFDRVAGAKGGSRMLNGESLDEVHMTLHHRL
jgi:hypothetical protein